MIRLLLAIGALLAGAGCGGETRAEVPVEPVSVVRSYPHDPGAFTEGLFFRDGRLFESTGLEGHSQIREVRLEDGKVLRQVDLPPDLFGEGIVDVGGELVSVTWQTGIGFRWRLRDFRRLARFSYPGEGWGMTRAGPDIILSDGTATLRFLDPHTFKERRRLKVTADGKPVVALNELEYVRGEILANIWQTNLIARIDPASGAVKGWLDVSALGRPAPGLGRDSVPNGIAYDAKRGRLFVTGKNWARLYEIRLPG